KPANRGIPAEGSAGEGNPEIGDGAGRAGVRAGAHGFGAGNRFRAAPAAAQEGREAAAAVRSLSGLRALCDDHDGDEKDGAADDRRRSAAELGAAIWSLCGAAGAARVRKATAAAVRLRGADLSGAGALGRAFGKHVHGGSELGEIRAAGRGRAAGGSV